MPLLPGKVIWKEDCFDFANFPLASEFLPLGTFMLLLQTGRMTKCLEYAGKHSDTSYVEPMMYNVLGGHRFESQ